MKKILFILFTAGIMYACNLETEKEIEWKLDDYPEMLVVDGTLTNEYKQQTIQLTQTVAFFDTVKPAPVSGADLYVKEGNTLYTFSESDTRPGFYLSDQEFAAQPRKTYELSVTLENPLNGLTHYSAVSTMPDGIDMDTIFCEIYALPILDIDEGEDRDSTLLGIYYVGQEPPDRGNYYVARFYDNDVPWNSTAKEAQLLSDDYNNGNSVLFTIYLESVQDGDLIRFNLMSVEKTYYDFLKGLQQMDQAADAYSMSGPPANAVGNVSGGKALGFFTAAYVSEKTGIAVDKRGR